MMNLNFNEVFMIRNLLTRYKHELEAHDDLNTSPILKSNLKQASDLLRIFNEQVDKMTYFKRGR